MSADGCMGVMSAERCKVQKPSRSQQNNTVAQEENQVLLVRERERERERLLYTVMC